MVHDWDRVEAGIFHSFHTVWIGQINSALNDGRLPRGYYALAEQHAQRAIADVLTLQAPPSDSDSDDEPHSPPRLWESDSGGLAVAEAPPKTRRKQSLSTLTRRRTVAIRHVSGHRLVALIEIVSPGNKDRAQHVDDFLDKVESALANGVHVLVVDLLRPGRHDPQGLHGALFQRNTDSDDPYDLPPDEPLTLASYVADRPVDAYLEHLAISAAIPDMPLFLTPERYINVPLDSTYAAAYRGMPAFWREVLER